MEFKLEQFEGPLDILLQLIEKEELSITDISLAAVADQYLQFIENAEEIGAHELTDFLLVATKLLLLKSKLLLPKEEVDEEDGPSLEDQLKIYKEFLDASRNIEERLKAGNFSYTRKKLPFNIDPVFTPPETVSSQTLHAILLEFLKTLEPIVVLPESVMEKTVTLREKMTEIQKKLTRGEQVNFLDMIRASRSKTETIVSFVALLELIKQKEVVAKQSENFNEILIQKYKSEDI